MGWSNRYSRGTIPPGSSPAGRRRRLRMAVAVALTLTSSLSARAASVLTNRNDNARSGLNPDEQVLTPATVSAATFGMIFSHPVDGAVYAQPLVMTGVSVLNQGTHNVVFVATEHDSVYAFDADNALGLNAAPLWRRSLLNDAPAGTMAAPVPSEDVGTPDLSPEIGITSTPVIDPVTGTLYTVAKTKEVSATGTSYLQRLHALDVGSGAEKFGGPVVISASVNGAGAGTDGSGHVPFIALRELNRPGLLLLNGIVYIAFGSHGDVPPTHGWLLGYDAATLQQVAVLNLTPNGNLGSIWMSGCGPAADQQGNIFVSTGNGDYDLSTGGVEAGDSDLRLQPGAGGIAIADYFTPTNQVTLSDLDLDLGSGGILLLPDQPTEPKHLAVQCGKEGRIYVLDRDNMGHFNAAGDNVVQSFKALPSCYSTPVFFNDTLFYGPGDGASQGLSAFGFAGGQFTTAAVSQAATGFPYPGVSPVVSANGSSNGVLWVIEPSLPAVLHAYLPADLSQELYDSNQAEGGADHPGDGVKFAVPTVCNGKVYVGTQNGVYVYGLRPQVRRARRVVHRGS